MPDPLREWLDRQDRQTRNEALQTLKRVDRESGWAAVEAMLSILESTGGADRAGVTLLAARLAEGVAGIETEDTEERGLFSEDRAALLPLPGKRFDVVTWRHMKADRYGVAAPGDGIAVPRTGRTRAEG